MTDNKRFTPTEAVAALDAITDDGDPAGSHLEADKILRGTVAPEVAEAYERLVERTGAWWYA